MPQFYLRRFSKGNPYILVFHKASGRFIPKAPIKGQCAIDNFYDWHEAIEPTLGIMEGEGARIFREIDATERLPNPTSADWLSLLSFIAIQSSRTQLSGRDSDAVADYYAKIMMQGALELDGIDTSKFQIRSKFPAALPMAIAAQSVPIFLELRGHLLVNNTSTPFFSSDNPVLFYNSALSHIQHHGVIGLSSQGLQIFYPISPRLMIVLYDGSTYRVPAASRVKKLRHIDVIRHNILHYFWSGDVVFPSSTEQHAMIHDLRALAASYPFERSVNEESLPVQTGDDEIRTLTHTYRSQVPVEIEFDWIKTRSQFEPTPNLMRGEFPFEHDKGPSGISYQFERTNRRDTLKGSALNKLVKRHSRLR